MALTFFLIGNLVIVGLSVANAFEPAKLLTRQKMRAVVTYEIDYDTFYKDAEQIEDEDLELDENEILEDLHPIDTYNEMQDFIEEEQNKDLESDL